MVEITRERDREARHLGHDGSLPGPHRALQPSYRLVNGVVIPRRRKPQWSFFYCGERGAWRELLAADLSEVIQNPLARRGQESTRDETERHASETPCAGVP